MSNTKKALLTIKKLSVSTAGKAIVKGFDLSIRPGELQVLMGPNGSGKSTIAYALLGHPNYKIRATELRFAGRDIKKLKTDERARLGLFLGFQYPNTISGLSLSNVLPMAMAHKLTAKRIKQREYATLAQRSAYEQNIAQEWFREEVNDHLKSLHMDQEMLYRSMNEGFSGGEKKKSEILQMLTLKPKLAILDEPDSGLDVDALRTIALAIKEAHQNGMAILLITHYQRILKYLKPDKVHVLRNGTLMKSGGPELARVIERTGYESLK